MSAGIATETRSQLGVLGAADIEERFCRTLERGRLASTYLFVGPAGVGKRLFAQRLARALLCQQPDGLKACGQCESCRLESAGTHPDLIQLARPKGKSTLPLELFLGPSEARMRSGLCHDLALRPLVSTRRVAVIDDADYFSVESANCLLKTLEEPPPHSLIFLVGTSLARQLPTIRSRSQVIRFSPLAEEQVASILTEEPFTLDPAEAESLAAASQGSVSRALAARDEGLGRAIRVVLDCVQADRIDAIRLGQHLEEAAKEGGAEASARRERLHTVLGALFGHFHSQLRRGNQSITELDRLLASLETCLEAEQALHRNANQSAWIQWFACSLGRLA